MRSNTNIAFCCTAALMVGMRATADPDVASVKSRANRFLAEIRSLSARTSIHEDAASRIQPTSEKLGEAATSSINAVQDTFWRPRYRLTYFDGEFESAVLEVTRQDGTFTRYYDYRLASEMHRNAGKEATPISEAEAIAVSERAIRLTGTSEELGPPRAHYFQVLDPRRAPDKYGTYLGTA